MTKIPVTCRNDEDAVSTQWARRLDAALKTRFPRAASVRWYLEPAKPGIPRTEIEHYFEVRDGRQAARVRLLWRAAEPDSLYLTAGAAGMPKRKTFMGRVFGALALVAALVAFLLWCWFAYETVPKLPTFFGHARHNLEVAWLLLGWGVGPAFAAVGVSAIGDWFDTRAYEAQKKVAEGFAREQLDATLAAAVHQALAACAGDDALTKQLGQAHTGAAHPKHPNVVYAAKGDYRPAPGYTWASDDPKSMAVKLLEK